MSDFVVQMAEREKCYKEAVLKSIRQNHGCDGAYRTTVRVDRVTEGQTEWSGEVEVFQLSGQPEGTEWYAWEWGGGWWALNDKSDWKIITMLKTPSVSSPREAVQAARAQGKFR